ncbi:acetyl/propionyl/methylcrotonyl-CoA carboxylase subunit alpha [Pseudorhodoferax sp.]|uniref:acetyl/propionyl/methylcrotonyl-CoA carboxylase subunit alpha n=1 Tax=Pseudorhodoferax sp. TaxID=1993553 RepID=UPI002DD69186|nr:acetyl/propionyl/methylcrotonyl-CoA carboxylase subunit alpha [Pseudorhodoferax sp.]
MFNKILIANRGEIACRVAATARRLGVKTVAVYSEADADARHVAACDEAVAIGASPPRESYLRWQAILDAAKATGAQAVHPGYGFLSENQDFARACADAGLVFIGPPAEAIAAMGSKSAAKALMEKAGVPLVPGYHGQDNSPELLAREAARIGYPVLIKASAGGGGKGMRRVERAQDFAEALASCQREAKASFGDDHVLVERYVTRPRHIEIQVFGDSHGNVIHLGERDCSVQRRHQKVLEESPAPGLSAARRAEMGAAAVAAARAVGYVGAGTVEFVAEELDDGDIRAYFMEMNTRLQVEHPVTEAVTGLDLVEWQLRVASGEPLPLAQDQLALNGHAIEARICAENPEAQFLPATGTLQVMRWPAHVAFTRGDVLPRVDTGFGEGDVVSPFYDSMIAKLIVWGRDRAQALARLDSALRDTHIAGLNTNVAFVRRVVGSQAFATADLDTALIERERPALFGAAPLPDVLAAAGVVARVLADEQAAEGADPWSRRDGWRLHGGARRRLELEVQGKPARTLAVVMQRLHDGATTLHIGSEQWPLATRALGGDAFDLLLGSERHRLTVYLRGDQYTVFSAQGSARLTQIDPLARAADQAGDHGGLTAPMPGKLVGFMAKAGERVKRGQPLAVMEAMKMEHTISAPRDGLVQELLYASGDQIAEGAELLRLAPEQGAA